LKPNPFRGWVVHPTNDDNLEKELFKKSRKVVDNLISAILNKNEKIKKRN
jgi:hypothetical protein